MIMDAIPLKPVYAQHTGPWSSKNMHGPVKIYLKFHRKVRTTWVFFPDKHDCFFAISAM